MAKYEIHADTETGMYAFLKDGKEVPHEEACMSSYMTHDYDKDGNKVKKRRVYLSHKTHENGVHEQHDVAFYLGDPQTPSDMNTPNYDVPSAVAKVVETAIQASKLNKVLASKKK